jgi:hypothetical protein
MPVDLCWGGRRWNFIATTSFCAVISGPLPDSGRPEGRHPALEPTVAFGEQFH